MRRQAVAAASDEAARDAAQAYLDAGGDAIGAVVSGFFAAAGDSPGVLFGAVGLIVAQVGIGVRAFDGRLRQAGLGQRRPRGLGPDEAVPPAARIGAPSGVAALLVALRYGRSAALSKVLASGIGLAKKAGCERRAEALDAIERLGAAALSSPGISRPLIHRAGPSEGGALGVGDLEFIPQLDHPARARDNLRVVPWADERLDPAHVSAFEWSERLLRQQGICASDVGGGLAALCYDQVASGLVIEELELVLPLDAVPTRRGLPRIAPGRFLPAPAAIAIELSDTEAPLAATVTLGEGPPLRVIAS